MGYYAIWDEATTKHKTTKKVHAHALKSAYFMTMPHTVYAEASLSPLALRLIQQSTQIASPIEPMVDQQFKCWLSMGQHYKTHLLPGQYFVT